MFNTQASVRPKEYDIIPENGSLRKDLWNKNTKWRRENNVRQIKENRRHFQTNYLTSVY